MIHIGKIIEERANEIRIGSTELGRLIATSKQNVYQIFKRETIDTGLLLRLSKVLKKNFFAYYLLENEDSDTGVNSELQSLKNEVAHLKKQIEVQEKYIALLEKNK